MVDSASKPAIVLLHGFPFNHSMWREQIDFLDAHGFGCCAPDLRGLGKNVARESASEDDHTLESVPPATMEDMARDVLALLDKVLKSDRFVICGLSMGCYVAFEFIRLFPERVRALVLCGPKAEGPDETERQSRETQALRALAEGMRFAVESILQSLLATATVKTKADVIARVTEMVLKTDPKGAAAAQRGMAARRDYSHDLAEIKVPTLIVAGREDGVRKPEDAELIQQRIKGSELVVIDAAGHLMNMEQPEVFNAVLLSFLRNLNH